MRHRAYRLLHVLASALTAAAAVAVPALLAPAPVRAAAQPPKPYVVAIDPGHGGTPDNNNPDLPYDPGVIGVNGLQEKDLTLDIAQRAQALLTSDKVKVVMTRTTDDYVGIGTRMQAALDAHASLFISIHFNSFTDPSAGGALVLYPDDNSQMFAQIINKTTVHSLQPYGIADNGIQNKPELWQHATMPTVTVEAAYLTNSHDAAQLAIPAFRQSLAQGIVTGIEMQAPDIAYKKAQLAAWQTAHPTATSMTDAAHGMRIGVSLDLVTLGVLAFAMVRFRKQTFPLTAMLCQFIFSLMCAIVRSGYSRYRSRSGHSLPSRRVARRQALLQQSRSVPRRQSIYDQLGL